MSAPLASTSPEKAGDNWQREPEAAQLLTLSFPLQPPRNLLTGVCVHLLLSSSSSTPVLWPLHTSPGGNSLAKVLSASLLPAQWYLQVSSSLLSSLDILLLFETLPLSCCASLHGGLFPLSPLLAPSPVPPLDVACGWSWTYFSSIHSH